MSDPVFASRGDCGCSGGPSTVRWVVEAGLDGLGVPRRDKDGITVRPILNTCLTSPPREMLLGVLAPVASVRIWNGSGSSARSVLMAAESVLGSQTPNFPRGILNPCTNYSREC